MLTPQIENPTAIVRTIEEHDQKPKRKRRRTRSKNLDGQIVDCESVATSKLISVFLRSLSPKEKGFALRLLLQLAKDQQAKPGE